MKVTFTMAAIGISRKLDATVVVGESPATRELLRIEPEQIASFIDSSQLPKPISFVQVMVTAALVAGMATIGASFTQWYFYVHLGLPAVHHLRLLNSLSGAVITFLLVFALMQRARERRRNTIKRTVVVAEANHHIRNAMQSMYGSAFLSSSSCATTNHSANYETILEAVRRIETVLSEVLPNVHDDKENWLWSTRR